MNMIILNDDIVQLLIDKGYGYEEINKLISSNEMKVTIEKRKDATFAGKPVPLPYYYRNNRYIEIHDNKYMLPNLDSIGNYYTDESNYKEELHNQKVRLKLN